MLLKFKDPFSFLFFILSLRIVAGAIHSFFPVTSPHIWRQTHTLSVAMRYWSRWFIEQDGLPWWFPAVLESRDTVGIMPMEFPFLGMVTAGSFFFGPFWGKTVIHLLHLSLMTGLIYANYRVWKGKKILGFDGSLMVLLSGCFSFGAPFFAKFIPDPFAMLLVLWACGLSWEKRSFLGFVLAALGLLMKPPTVTTFAIFLLHPLPWRAIRSNLFLFVGTISIAVLYYKGVNPYIDHFREIPPLFATEFRDPLVSFLQFFSSPMKLLKLLNDHAFFPWGLTIGLLSLPFLISQSHSKFYQAGLVFLLQVVFIGILDGDHAFVHFYYFIGSVPICSLLFLYCWQHVRLKILAAALPIFFLGHSLELVSQDLRGIWKKDSSAQLFKECKEMRQKNPQLPWGKGQVFRAYPEEYPFLGFCFGEREGSEKASYGFYFLGQQIPQSCQVIDQSSHLLIAYCDKA